MKIDINSVQITLTKDQLKEINKQLDKNKTIEDINSYEDALEILDEEAKKNPSPTDKLLTIIKAVNYIDNGNKKWKPNFNGNSYNYYPYFKESNTGWVLGGCDFSGWGTAMGFGYYFKVENSAKLIAKKHIFLYNEWLNQE